MTVILSSSEKLALCIQALARCLYWMEFDKACGYGERAKECHADIIETLQAVNPSVIDEIRKKVRYDLYNGVDTNAGRSTDN